MEDFFSLKVKGGVCGRGVFLIYALSLRLPCSMNKIKKKKKKDLVGGFGWSHIRDDGNEGGEEDEEEGRRGVNAAEAVGVGKYLSFVILRLVWNFVSLTDDDFHTYCSECNFFY